MVFMQAHKDKSPGSSSTSKATAALRAQIQFELQNKKQCCYQPYECSQLSLDGYDYCMRHILSNKSAPFKQCNYVYGSNGKRCCLPAPPKIDKKELGYCNEHALKAHLVRAKQGSRPPPPYTAEVLLNSLTHYVRKPRMRNVAPNSNQQSEEAGRSTPDEGEAKVTKSLDPFTDIDAAQMNTSCSDVLDMCSESESDVEATTYTNIWQDAQADSSEDESIDSDQEDVLKHANVYSAEEITLVTRDKLIRLQSLYIDQYHHLQHMLREKRRKYLQALKREKETCCSIANQAKDNPKEQRLYKKLKAYNQYHRKMGTDAILRKRLNEMRMKITEGIQNKPQSYQTKCAFTEGGVKCVEKALPVARHCRKHILEDPNQVLFRACGKKRADMECNTAVEMIFEDQSCPLHRDIPLIKSYSHIRKDSESDYDETHELSMNNPNVKTEIIDYIKTMDVSNSMFFDGDNTNSMEDFPVPKMEDFPVCKMEDSSMEIDVTNIKEEDETEDEVSSQNNLQIDNTNQNSDEPAEQIE